MTQPRTASTAIALERSVRKICEAIARSPRPSLGSVPLEAFHFEMARAILSSQVSWDMATVASHRLKERGLLERGYVRSRQRRISVALTEPVSLNGRRQRYRFPNVRARQLSEALDASQDGIAAELARSPQVMEFEQALGLRRQLVFVLPGVGPKQASMILRNIRISYDLAIIDRHVLGFLHILGATGPIAATVCEREYMRLEEWLRGYAAGIGESMAVVDLAIWTTMRAARQEGVL